MLDEKRQFEQPHTESKGCEIATPALLKNVWISTSMSQQALEIVSTCDLKMLAFQQ